MLATGKYHKFIELRSTRYIRPLKTQPSINLVVSTPVMAGVLPASIDFHSVPSYINGLSTPLNKYRNDPPAVVIITDCHRLIAGHLQLRRQQAPVT